MSSAGNKFVVVICEYLICHLETVSLHSCGTDYVADALVKLLFQKGVPRKITLDESTNLTISYLSVTREITGWVPWCGKKQPTANHLGRTLDPYRMPPKSTNHHIGWLITTGTWWRSWKRCRSVAWSSRSPWMSITLGPREGRITEVLWWG